MTRVFKFVTFVFFISLIFGTMGAGAQCPRPSFIAGIVANGPVISWEDCKPANSAYQVRIRKEGSAKSLYFITANNSQWFPGAPSGKWEIIVRVRCQAANGYKFGEWTTIHDIDYTGHSIQVTNTGVQY